MRPAAIFGVGLIGGSFALALREAGFEGEILGVSSPSSIAAALARGAIDRGAGFEEAASAAGLLYFAQPIGRILEMVPRAQALARPDALITDAGSTKSAIVARGRGRVQFLGGHPLAGKESRGVKAAEAGLFRDRIYVLTPQSRDELDTPAARWFLECLRRIGAEPVVMSPEEHDCVVAFTSHLPQLASTALACTVNPGHARVSGSGLADMTRLALSSWDVWRDILATNPENIERALGEYIAALESLRARLPDLRADFERAAALASRLRQNS